MKKRIFPRLAALTLLTLSLLMLPTLAAHDEPLDFYRQLHEHLTALDESFVIPYDNDPMMLDWYEGHPSAALMVRSAAAFLPSDDLSLDVALLNLNEAVCTYENCAFTFEVEYLLDAEKLACADEAVKQIADSLPLEGLDDLRRLMTVCEYVASHYTYDDTLTKYTDYDGLTTGSMVCQGFSLLTDKLLRAVGIPCRIVTGTTGGTPHGWNLVELDGRWYAVDVTWSRADPFVTWDYFLRAPEELTDHSWDSRFASPVFTDRHPCAKKDYILPRLTIQIDGTRYSSLTIRKGITRQLQAVCTPATRLPIRWSSTDESAVSVSADGVLESVASGGAIVIARTDDIAILPDYFPVNAVDLTGVSPWAEKHFTSYYLRGLYPAALCENYQQPITRGEFAYLLYLLMSSYAPSGGVYMAPGFEDIEDSPWWTGILYTTVRGMFDGTSLQTFRPDDPMTREMTATVFSRVLSLLQSEPETEPYAVPEDAAEISDWAAPAVDRVLSAGMMDCPGAFRPKQTLTREEAGVLLEHLFLRFLDPALEAAA